MQHYIYIKKIESSKRSSRAKTDKIDNKYANSNNTVKKIILVVKTSSKIYEPKTYKKVIIELIYFRQQRDAIEEKIQNFKNH